MNKIWSKLTDNQLLDNEVNDLQSFRQTVLTIAFYGIASTLVILSILHVYIYGAVSLYFYIPVFLIAATGLYFLKLNKVELARLVAQIIYYVVFTVTLYIEWTSFRFYIVIFPISSFALLLLSSNKRTIWIEYFLIITLVTAAFYNFNFNWIDTCIALIMLGIFFIMLRNLIISLQGKLIEEIEKVKSLNDELKLKNYYIPKTRSKIYFGFLDLYNHTPAYFSIKRTIKSFNRSTFILSVVGLRCVLPIPLSSVKKT